MSAARGKVVSFGEVLLRMSPREGGGWIEQASMPVFVGGAEANVATALAGWGVPTKYITALPPHYLGDDVAHYFASRGLDTSAIHRSGARVGLYYLQQGADLKHAGVVYDRAHSAFSELRPGMIDWHAALEGAAWFNFSAITPALNEHMPAVCEEALKAALDKGLRVSLDLNYRAKLWQWGKAPVDVMPQLAQYCDVIMGNIWAAKLLLGSPLDGSVETLHDKTAYLEHARRTSENIVQQFPRCTAVANTFRFERQPQGLEYYTTLFAEGRQVVSPHFLAESVVDKIGSGDCFMAGIIYGLYHGHSPQQTLDFATAAAFGKLSEVGDATRQSVAAVQTILDRHHATTFEGASA